MADISRSTFFNYFPARDNAIVGRALELPENAEAFAILDTSPDDLPRGIFRLMFAAIGHSKVNSEVARLRNQLISEQPAAGRLMLSNYLENTYTLTGTVVHWLMAHPEHSRTGDPVREAGLAVTLVTGVILVQMSEWMTGEGDVNASEDDFERVMDEYIRVIGR